MAGEKGWGIFVPPLLPWKVLEAPLNIYKKACAEHGHAPDIVYIRPVYLDDDESVIRREVEQALLNFLAFNASPVESLQERSKEAGTSGQRIWLLCQRSVGVADQADVRRNRGPGDRLYRDAGEGRPAGRRTCKPRAASANWRSSPISAGWKIGRASRLSNCSRSE